QMVHPEIEWVDAASDGGPRERAASPLSRGEPGESALHMGRLVPIYPLTEGLSQRWFRGIVHTVLNRYGASAVDLLPEDLRRRRQLAPLAEALRQIHFPESWDRLAQAQRRLAFEELFLLQLRLALRRARMTSRCKPRCYQLEGPLTEHFFRRLPFALTPSQRQALDEMMADLRAPAPMLRLLQGDVGSGKTVVAAALMAVAVQSGYQAVLMAPTELLAEQHARVLRGYFEPLGVPVALLSQGPAPADRARLRQRIAAGTVGVVVGTHALLERAVTFKNLALVVIDEQHKFGVAQRRTLATKSQTPDVLVMTATPIPRTLALSVYGDLAYSVLRELPPGRLPIRTLLYGDSDRPEVYRLIREELRRGRQGYVVYPLVEATRQELRAAAQMAKTLQAQVFPEFRVELLHGQMRPKQKDAVMRGFLERQIHLLVSTVIVEVGLDVPNAAVMLIEHPERFGLAQLHQLRGRIGRGAEQGLCLVISGTTDETARQRLSAFGSTTDGFRLAEADLELRGPGELLGRQQHGWLRFRVASLVRDREVLEAARQEAFALIEQDPQLSRPDAAALRSRLTRSSAA
ncbi:MAG: ATP-dependent DNA helicase RecG, partial [Candidatus Omnitrophica bacterium]|nr:ATP-dependent DNA helicase RecG [Candidatus Omnitrophota bacterium]